jgi:hypothetical protein
VRRYRIADDGALVATDLGGGEAGQGHSLAPAAGVMPGM